MLHGLQFNSNLQKVQDVFSDKSDNNIELNSSFAGAIYS